MSKLHVILLTEEEVKAQANAYRVLLKFWGKVPYVQELEENGGASAFEKLMAKIEEINNDPDRK